MGVRVGIDLGTTFSAVARINPQSGKAEVIRNGVGKPITPSVLCFQPDGSVLFGEDAKLEQAAGNTDTVAFFKRSMGNDAFAIDFFGKSYTAEDLSAIFLKHLVQDAEEQIGEKIDSAVITVPAYFAHKERTATMNAGKKAGLNVLAIINEPTAAAFAYGLNEKSGDQVVLVYDLGGGTFDVTVARIRKDQIEILGSDGNHELGGKDWDDCIARYLAEQFEEKYGLDITEDPEAVTSLLVAAENAKKQLTNKDVVQVPIAFGGTRGNVEITEKTFEEISDYLLGETRDLTERLLKSIKLSWKNITGTILVGGSTRMRMVHGYVRQMTGKDPLGGVNVDEAVALGAAIRANIETDGKTVKSLMTLGGASGAPMLTIAGAKAVKDVTAHALGMISASTDNKRFVNSVIIPKNTTIPAAEHRDFKFQTRPIGDNALEVYVLQGAYERPLDNSILNKYVLEGISHVEKKPAVIDIAYCYTENGIVEVSAKQKETGKTLTVHAEPVPEDMSWTDGSPADVVTSKPLRLRVMLAVDLSGSMGGEPLFEAKKAMCSFVNQLKETGAEIGVIGFADLDRVYVPLMNDYDQVKSLIKKLDCDSRIGYGTNAVPFGTAAEELYEDQSEEEGLYYMIVLTDGEWFQQDMAIQEARECRDRGMEIVALGFGDADENFLRQIASKPDFAELTNLKNLTGSFSRIAQAIGSGGGGGLFRFK